VRSLDRTGILLELLDEGRSARVQLGAVTAEVAAADLAPAPPAPARPAAPREKPPRAAHPSRRPAGQGAAAASGQARSAGAGAAAALSTGAPAADGTATQPRVPSLLPTAENTLDLRGLRLDEALEQAERFFDVCMMKHVSPVMLIHGHGTGKLKAGLRERLKDSRYVAHLRPGEAGEGRDGVTVVALNL
jgi:DNA mismatch repair protein MutS2